MNRAIFSAAIFFITCFLFQGMALATGGSWGHHHSNTSKVHNLADILKSGEIIGLVSFCGSRGTNGAQVDLVGESFQAVLGASGEFRLRYVPRGVYTLRVSIPGQPDHTQPLWVKKRKVTNVGEIALCPDNDNDGFAVDVDCNDNNGEIFPGAEELCDGVDNDCDGAVDGPGCNCTDADNDSFFAQDGCGTAVDCNDEDDTIKPGAQEICDGIDNNCDNTIDEGFDLNTDLNNCGACSSVCSGSCQAGVCFSVCGNGVVEDGEECDDGNTNDGDECNADCTVPTCAPGLTECNGECVDLNTDVNHCSQCNQACGVGEACESGICQVDPNQCQLGETQCGADCVDLRTDVNNCGSCGRACNAGEECAGGSCRAADNDGDGFDTSVDCDDNNPSVNPGAPETCNGIDDNCDGQTDEGTVAGECNDGNICTADVCNSSSGCSNTFLPPGTACGSGLECNGSGACVPSATCGNGVVEAGEQCDGGGPCCNPDCTLASADTVCRPANGVCDVQETCDGVTSDCPIDEFAPAGTSCGSGLECINGGLCLPRTCPVGQIFCDGICILAPFCP